MGSNRIALFMRFQRREDLQELGEQPSLNQLVQVRLWSANSLSMGLCIGTAGMGDRYFNAFDSHQNRTSSEASFGSLGACFHKKPHFTAQVGIILEYHLIKRPATSSEAGRSYLFVYDLSSTLSSTEDFGQ